MDSEILNELMVKITYELRDFIPRNLFHPLEMGIKHNGRLLSEEEGRGFLASGFAETLFYAPPKNSFLTDRQYVASELLMYLGHLISIETTDPQRPVVISNLLKSFEKYRRDYLTEQEAKPYISLPEYVSEQTIQQAVTPKIKRRRVNQTQAFLQDCFISSGIEKNIESIWLHIQKNAGKPGFLFVTSSKESATTTDGKKIKKKNMSRSISNLIKIK